MAHEFITYRVADRIAYVTINRPQVMNALHPAANAEMLDAFISFRDDDDAWIAILTGAGDRAFSAGDDLRATAERTARGEQRVAGAGVALGGITVGFECPKPPRSEPGADTPNWANSEPGPYPSSGPGWSTPAVCTAVT